jgi:uncharacterized protein (DUF342 family)
VILCKASELKPGMIVMQDVTVSGISIPVIRKGVVLNEQYINSIKKYGIGFLHVEPIEGYSGTKEEVLLLTEIRDNIVFEGRVETNGNIPANITVEAGGGVIVKGNVAEGCYISSKTGAIFIKGFVYGTGNHHVQLYAKQKISVDGAAHATIKTDGDFITEGNVIDVTIEAKGEVNIKGMVVRGRINTGARAILGECGNKEGEPVTVTAIPLEAQEITQGLLKIDSQTEELSREKTELQNVIDLIKKLGGNVQQLPEDKKIELANGVKRFKGIAEEIIALTSRKSELMDNMKQILVLRRIIVHREIYPNVKIQIGGKTLTTTKTEQRCAFSVEEGKIVMKTI